VRRIQIARVCQAHGIDRPVTLRHDHHFCDVGDQFGGIRANHMLTQERGFEFGCIAHVIDWETRRNPQMHDVTVPHARNEFADGDLRQPQPEGIPHRIFVSGPPP